VSFLCESHLQGMVDFIHFPKLGLFFSLNLHVMVPSLLFSLRKVRDNLVVYIFLPLQFFFQLFLC